MNEETDKDLLQAEAGDELGVHALFDSLQQAEQPARATPTYTEQDENDLDSEDWEYYIHRTDR